jgi:muramoyltetrapeptide carboxypeptidase
MKTPPFLIPGSKIRIVSPAGKCCEEHIFPAVKWLKDNGFIIESGKHVFGHYYQFSGTETERRSDLQEALDDPEAVVIICSRGGYGTIHLLDHLDLSGFRKYPKWLVGYSDITTLHNLIHQAGYQSIHGVMCRHFVDECGNPTDSLNSLIKVLKGEKPLCEFPGNPLNRRGTVTAMLVGGNLSILYSLTGTPYDPDTAGKILFIEETSEYLYHIDRMMNGLRLCGKLRYLAGLVVGQFSDIKDNPEPFGKIVEEIILDAVKEYDFPVCFGLPAGHDQPNLAIRLGASYNLNVTAETCSLQII